MTHAVTLSLGLTLGVALLVSGCVTKAKANARAREAFLAGQHQAMQQMQLRGPTVTVVGEVRNPLVPWSGDLTLAKAIIAAEYFGAADPVEITVTREGEEIRVDLKTLLSGEDIPLQPRDVIELRR